MSGRSTLQEILTEMAVLLRRAGEGHWADLVGKAAKAPDITQAYRQMMGGMGSLNDFYLDRAPVWDRVLFDLLREAAYLVSTQEFTEETNEGLTAHREWPGWECTHCNAKGVAFETVEEKVAEDVLRERLAQYLWKGAPFPRPALSDSNFAQEARAELVATLKNADITVASGEGPCPVCHKSGRRWTQVEM